MPPGVVSWQMQGIYQVTVPLCASGRGRSFILLKLLFPSSPCNMVQHTTLGIQQSLDPLVSLHGVEASSFPVNTVFVVGIKPGDSPVR